MTATGVARTRSALTLPRERTFGLMLAAGTAVISGFSVFVNATAVKAVPDPAVFTTLKNLVAVAVLLVVAAALVRPAEVRAIKDALQFQGPVLAYDLSYNRPGHQSVYVEFAKQGEACDMFINDWVDHHNAAHKGAPIGNPGDHMISPPGKTTFTVPGNVFLQADITGQQKVEPIVVPGV